MTGAGSHAIILLSVGYRNYNQVQGNERLSFQNTGAAAQYTSQHCVASLDRHLPPLCYGN